MATIVARKRADGPCFTNAASAMSSAISHGEFAAAEELLRCGAPMDLATAAATGAIDIVREQLRSSAPEARHIALALACQHGHSEVLKLLLDAGEDPSRYNPVGFHAHSTPLHQAALAGHFDIVRVLAERGARLYIKDIHYGGTAADWAEHAQRGEIADYLRPRMRSQPFT